MTISRRTALIGAAAAVAASPALAKANPGSHGDDSELIALCEHFWARYREVQRTFTDWQACKYEIAADPTCPSMGQDFATYNQRMEDGGSHALFDDIGRYSTPEALTGAQALPPGEGIRGRKITPQR